MAWVYDKQGKVWHRNVGDTGSVSGLLECTTDGLPVYTVLGMGFALITCTTHRDRGM
jgi:hypothetical protein